MGTPQRGPHGENFTQLFLSGLKRSHYLKGKTSSSNNNNKKAVVKVSTPTQRTHQEILLNFMLWLLVNVSRTVC